MADKIITDFTELAATPADADALLIYDASASSPRTRHITVANLLSGVSVAQATTTSQGTVELATSAETITGTDTERATTPAAVGAAIANALLTAGAGDVVGPGSATDNALARFDSTTGKLVQNSTGILSDAGDLTVSSLTLTTDLAVTQGGTGASTAADARTNLGLGTIATQAASAVAITGGTVTGITDLAVADGGTGASTAAAARTNLGLGTAALTNTAQTITVGATGADHTTLNAAKTAATAGDSIRVLAGTYTATSNTTLAKDGVNWHFEPGAIVNATFDAASNNRALFDDHDGAITFAVTGHGVFNITAAVGTGANTDESRNPGACVRIWTANTVATFEADWIELTGQVTGYNGTDGGKAIHQRTGKLAVKMHRGINATGLGSCWVWEGGEIAMDCPYFAAEYDAITFSRTNNSRYAKAQAHIPYVYGGEHSIRFQGHASDLLTDVAITANMVDGFVISTSHTVGGKFALQANVVTDQMHLYGGADTWININLGRHEAKAGHLFAQFNANVRYTAQELLRTRTVKARLATTTNGTLATAFANGQTIDGTTLQTGDRILIKDQTDTTANGVYTVNSSGAPTRATDFDAWSEVPDTQVAIALGTAHAGRVFICNAAASGAVGSTAITFLPLGAICFRVHNGTSTIENVNMPASIVGAAPAIYVPSDGAGGVDLTLRNCYGVSDGLETAAAVNASVTFTVTAAGDDTDELTVTLDDGTNAADNFTVTQDGGKSTADLANELAVAIDAAGSYTATAVGSVISITCTETSAWGTNDVAATGTIAGALSGQSNFSASAAQGCILAESGFAITMSLRNCDFRAINDSSSTVGIRVPDGADTVTLANCTGNGASNIISTGGGATFTNLTPP